MSKQNLQVEPPFDAFVNEQEWQEFVNKKHHLLECDRALLW